MFLRKRNLTVFPPAFTERKLSVKRAGDRPWLPGSRCFVERACFHDMSECFFDNLQ